MFLGEFSHSIDDKGRLAIPKKFRGQLAQPIVTRGLDNCLFVYTPQEWEILAEKIKELPLTQANARSFVRMMFSGASECEVDKQGRIIIPQYLREFAGIKKNVILAGLFNRIEIWAEDTWNTYKTGAEQQQNAIAEQLAEFGIV